MSPHSDIVSWFRINQSLLFLLNTTCSAVKQQILILKTLVWPDQGSNPRSTTLEASTIRARTHDLPHWRRARLPLHHWCGLYLCICRCDMLRPGADTRFVVMGGVIRRGVWDRLRSPAGPRQSPGRELRGAKPPWSSGGLRNYRHLFERQFWINHTIFIRPKKLDFES